MERVRWIGIYWRLFPWRIVFLGVVLLLADSSGRVEIVFLSFSLVMVLRIERGFDLKRESNYIFHLRCRVTEAKNNKKGKYDNLECGACGLFEENQQHILECKVLNKEKSTEEIKYGNLLNGTVEEKLKIARKFRENFSILEKIKKEER